MLPENGILIRCHDARSSIGHFVPRFKMTLCNHFKRESIMTFRQSRAYIPTLGNNSFMEGSGDAGWMRLRELHTYNSLEEIAMTVICTLKCFIVTDATDVFQSGAVTFSMSASYLPLLVFPSLLNYPPPEF